MSEVSFSVAPEIKAFIDFYADRRLTTASAMAKKGMIAEMRRHPLDQAEVDEYEKSYGKAPPTCLPSRARAAPHLYSSSPNSPKDQEAKKEYERLVYLSEQEHSKLLAKYGAKNTTAALTKLSVYKGSTGKTYKSDYLTILNWVMGSVMGQKGATVPAPVKPDYCPECGVGGGNHGAFCSRKPA